MSTFQHFFAVDKVASDVQLYTDSWGKAEFRLVHLCHSLTLLLGDALFDSLQARDELTDQLDRFHEQVIKISHDMTKAQWRRAQRMHAAEAIPIE